MPKPDKNVPIINATLLTRPKRVSRRDPLDPKMAPPITNAVRISYHITRESTQGVQCSRR